MKYETRAEAAQRFSKIWWSSRAKTNKSQEYMALNLGVAKKTIQNWEKGISSPNLFQFFQWFKILELNPLPYILAFMYPESLDNINHTANNEAINTALTQLINNCSPLEKRQLLYVMHSTHGSTWRELLQMLTAYCHLSHRSRIAAASLIYDSYCLEYDTKEFVHPEHVQPDLKILYKGILEGKKRTRKRLLNQKR